MRVALLTMACGLLACSRSGFPGSLDGAPASGDRAGASREAASAVSCTPACVLPSLCGGGGQRGRCGPAVLSARRASGGIAVDGRLDEPAWASAVAVEFGDALRLSDNLATVRALWDEQRLLLGFTVVDPRIETPDAGLGNWQQDGVELFLDLGLDRSIGMQKDDFHLMLTVAGGKTASQGTGAVEKPQVVVPLPLSSAAQRNAAGFHLELELRWADLSASVAAGKSVGLLLANNDLDLGKLRQYDWMEIGDFSQPNRWGTLFLEGP